MLLFFTLCYLLVLQRFYFVRYVDLSTKIAINVNRYLLFLFAVPFCFSLVISVFLLAASVTGQAIGQTLVWYVTNGVGLEELEPTHEIVYSSSTGEWIVLNKQTGDRIHIPVESQDKIDRSSLVVEKETGENGNDSTSNSQVHSTSEKKNSFLGNLANILFRNLSQPVQQKILSQGADLLKSEILESNLEPGNQKAALIVVDNLADVKKAFPGAELGLPDLEKHGVEITSATVTRQMPDGSMARFRCIDPVKGYQDYVEILTKAGVVPKQGLVTREILIKCGEAAGYSQLICVSEQNISPLPDLPHAASGDNDGPVFEPGSPSWYA